MARHFEFFTGPCKWAMVDSPDKEYNCYKINIYLDKANLKKFNDSGLGLKIRSDDDGTYVVFRRYLDRLLDGMDEKPKKLINRDSEHAPETEDTDQYIPFDRAIGNGSIVTVKVETYEGKKGVGHRLEAVAVETLVPYDDADDQDLPF